MTLNVTPPTPVVNSYALGIGLTNECDLSCAHCYRSQLQLNRLNLKEVQQICQAVQVSSVNLGVGENGLHPQYHEILAWLHSQNIRVAVTSNGYSIEVLNDAELEQLHSVEFSIDYPTEAEQDTWRAEGNWRKCWEGVARCQSLGVRVAIIAVMMSTNYNRLGELASVAATHGCDLRFNLYQPVTTDNFTLSYTQLWAGLTDIFNRSEIVTISEPLVNALLDFPRPTQGSPCGRSSIRMLPSGLVSPCTYWPTPDRKLKDFYQEGAAILEAASFQAARSVPAACQDCSIVAKCGGGCASRRMLRGQLDQPDEYCPIVRQDTALLEKLELLKSKWQAATFKDLPKAGNACTFVVHAKS
jgi:radical SAM protein with 4Fe4S-binding SPASM domain